MGWGRHQRSGWGNRGSGQRQQQYLRQQYQQLQEQQYEQQQQQYLQQQFQQLQRRRYQQQLQQHGMAWSGEQLWKPGWRETGHGGRGRGQTTPHVLTAHFVPRGKSFVGQTGPTAVPVAISDRNVWVCNSRARNHMTGNAEHTFNLEAPSKGQEWVRIGDGTVKKVLCVGTLNLEFHCGTDVGVQLPRVYVVDWLVINLFSLHAVLAKHGITTKLDCSAPLRRQDHFPPGYQRLLSTSYKAFPLAPCLLYTSPSPRDKRQSRMPSSA